MDSLPDYDGKTKVHKLPVRPVASMAQASKSPGQPWPSSGSGSQATSQSKAGNIRGPGGKADHTGKARDDFSKAGENNPARSQTPRSSNSSRHVPGGTRPAPNGYGQS